MEKLKTKCFKTFSFSKIGYHQVDNEQNGIGVGLSTADALVNGLGGELKIVCVPSGKLFRKEVKFSIMIREES